MELVPVDVLIALRGFLKQMQSEERGQLVGMDPDEAFELGYRSAIIDFSRITGTPITEEM